jgi:hypothetical protein
MSFQFAIVGVYLRVSNGTCCHRRAGVKDYGVGWGRGLKRE